MLVGELLTDFLNLAGSTQSAFDMASCATGPNAVGWETVDSSPGPGLSTLFSPVSCPSWAEGGTVASKRARWGRGGARATPATCTCGQRRDSPDRSHCLLTGKNQHGFRSHQQGNLSSTGHADGLRVHALPEATVSYQLLVRALG